MARLIWDASEPDTLEHRRIRLLLEWDMKRRMKSYCPDPLTNDERSEINWKLSLKREAARNWLRRERALKIKVDSAPNVIRMKNWSKRR